MRLPTQRFLACHLTLLSALLAGSLTAQTVAPAAPATGEAEKKQTIVLDAFNVSASPTVGYRADKTVSGTLIANDVMAMPASERISSRIAANDAAES